MKRKGFTLIEILIASAILFILFEVGYYFYTSNFKYLKEEKDNAYIEAEVKSFMDFTNQSLKMAFQNTISVNTDEIEMELPLDDKQVIYDDYNNKKLIIKKLIIKKEGNSIIITQQKKEKKSATADPKEEKKSAIEGQKEEEEEKEKILSDKIKLFEIKKENNCIEINFKVNYDRGAEREYSIKYNIRE
ncbi:MAG: prepilin-type N-terminal cleavage/methylation domain-containing protein [Endomicrobia bacterium]|nr:prepilin-type N-terminal cleavage/methylation domain-containing protein [Endomicrobiia bacterium]